MTEIDANRIFFYMNDEQKVAWDRDVAWRLTIDATDRVSVDPSNDLWVLGRHPVHETAEKKRDWFNFDDLKWQTTWDRKLKRWHLYVFKNGRFQEWDLL